MRKNRKVIATLCCISLLLGGCQAGDGNTENQVDTEGKQEQTELSGTPTPCTTNMTADCVAALSFASTLFRTYDTAYADTLLVAAEQGWKYIEKNPDKYVQAVYSGEDNQHESLWAAGCLFYATGKQSYGEYFRNNYSRFLNLFDASKDGHSVGNMAYYGYYTYLLSENADSTAKAEITEKIRQWQKGAVSRYQSNPWNISLKEWNFWWGSFNVVLGTPQDMLVGAYVLKENFSQAVQMSADALHFILGENPMRKAFVTGHGEDAISCTFSNIYGNHEKGFPAGYMPGGMNAYDGAIISRYPIKCYVDEPFDWLTNENAIYWNAVLVFNAAAQK